MFNDTFCVLHYSTFQKLLLRAKASARCLRLLIHLSSVTSASLSWWVSLVGFPANASFPVEELDPTVGIWTNASLKLEGHGNLLETRATPGSMVALSEPGVHVSLHLDNGTAAAYIR